MRRAACGLNCSGVTVVSSLAFVWDETSMVQSLYGFGIRGSELSLGLVLSRGMRLVCHFEFGAVLRVFSLF